MDTPDDATKDKRHDVSVKALQFELELFWKRSLFFWGFIGAAFVAFAAAKDDEPIKAVIASFGFVCSMVWTLVNRGSKYWYENWEQKLVQSESCVTGNFYGNPETNGWPMGDELRLRKGVGAWLRRIGWRAFKAERYSPSGLAIAIGDYVVALWFCLLASRVYLILIASGWFKWRNGVVSFFVVVFTVLSFVFAVLLRWLCKSS